MQTATNRQQSDQIYKEFRSTPLQKWQGDSSKAAARLIASKGFDLEGKDPHRFARVVRLLGRVAHETDSEGFYKALTNGELPPMKMSPEEMEFVRGGAVTTGTVILIACAGVAVGAGIGALCNWLAD